MLVRDSKAQVAMRKERLKDVAFDDLYPPQPNRPMIDKEKNRQISWTLTGKNRNTWLDQHIKLDAKDKKLPSNQYFKTEKGHQVDLVKYKPDLMFKSSKHLISPLEK